MFDFETDIKDASIVAVIVSNNNGKYDIYDINCNGFISKEKLTDIIKMCNSFVNETIFNPTVKFYYQFDANTTILVNVNYLEHLNNMSRLELFNMVWGTLPYNTEMKIHKW